jgi:glycosyltransferase involved in cell wall biosynthesis
VPSAEADSRALVAINARAAVRAEIGGVERFAREMARRLPALRPERYRVVRPPVALAHRAGHVWEQVALPLQARDCQLVYSPANLAPALSSRNVVVIHDAAALRHPEAYSSLYVAYQRRILPLIAARAELVITVSEFSRRELIELLGVSPERVRVIPEGVGERFTPGVDPTRVRERHGLGGPYALAVGTASERKNLSALEPAARALGELGIELVLAGSGRDYLRGAQSALRRLGYVSEELLPGLYAGALALVLPSRYEGFGLPCLEAMAAGVPVVAAAASALPETCGGAAIMVAPDDPDRFAGALVDATSDEAVRARLIAAGIDRASRFPWNRTAALTDEAITELLSR